MIADRWLVKDLDHFAGFAHAIHTYLGGVALAHYYNMSLLHMPFVSAHGMGTHFDDFFMGDDRRLALPLAAPRLDVDRQAQVVIGGHAMALATVPRAGSTGAVTAKLRAAPSHSLTWVKKGRFAFADANVSLCPNCTVTPEARYTALWLRERFWRAARAWESRTLPAAQSPTPRGRSRSRGAAAAATTAGAAGAPAVMANASAGAIITIAIHVRRGDVTYLDKYGRPSAR